MSYMLILCAAGAIHTRVGQQKYTYDIIHVYISMYIPYSLWHRQDVKKGRLSYEWSENNFSSSDVK